MTNVNIEITNAAQAYVKDAIKWKSRTEGKEIARDKVKSAIVV